MCVRMVPLTYEEAVAALDSRERTGRARIGRRDEFDPVYDAYPGSEVPAYVTDSADRLAVAKLTWGFALEGRRGLVYNTRIETALDQLRRGGRGMWAGAIVRGRCLVPVRAFYEAHASETIASEGTGKPVRRQYRFRMPGAGAFLLAGVQHEGRLSIVTTAPNADVAPRARPHAVGSGPRRVRRLARPRFRTPRGPQRHSVGD